jgi:hypothetical protein
VIAGFEILNAGSDVGDDARTLVAAEYREPCHRHAAGHQVVIGVAESGRFQLYLDFAVAGIPDLDLLDGSRLVERPDQSAFGLHGLGRLRSLSG